MVENDQQSRRQNGVYYTPVELSRHLIKPLLRLEKPKNILDPSCGNGSLLISAHKSFNCEIEENKIKLFGCDISPDNINLETIKPEKIWKCDFLELQVKEKFDLVLMNPPYVRHQGIPRNLKFAYNQSFHPICPISKTADLWAYFIIKSVEVLKKGGNIAAILPWSFLQADFSSILRAWLADRFSKIDILTVSSQLFEHADERVALVWLIDKGHPAQSIKIRNVASLTEDNAQHINLSWDEWLRRRVVATDTGPIDDILSSFFDKGFIPLRNVAKIKIGTVTGADKFFITDKLCAHDLGLKKEDCVSIIKTLKNLNGFCLNGNCPDLYLMHFPENLINSRITKYIDKGKNDGIHLRAHSLRRKVWYSIPKQNPPDAFFPYRSIHTPYIVINKARCLCTNSIHSIYWNDLTNNQIEWVQLSLLSVFGQLSLEASGKIYGTGVLKIEPSTLKNAIVVAGFESLPKGIYKEINSLLKKNERRNASELATNTIKKYFNVDNETIKICNTLLTELRQRRDSNLW